MFPLKRPQILDPKDIWIHAGELEPKDSTWDGIGTHEPVLMVGCHRNSDDYKFRDFIKSNISYDELTIWTRKLDKNKSVDEILYFMGGYREFAIVMSVGISRSSGIYFFSSQV